jgi:hypothetical protein
MPFVFWAKSPKTVMKSSPGKDSKMDEQKPPTLNIDQSSGRTVGTRRTGDLVDVITGTVVAVGLYFALLWFARHYDNGQELQLLVLVGIVGGVAGWIVGILASPYDPAERSSFSDLAKLVYGFLTGYLVSKIDPVVNRLLDVSPGKPTRPLIYGLFAMACFMIAVAYTYIGRTYWITKTQRSRSLGK